ncbi:hypothetical protein [Aequorivita capsosiphonis]|uniref:hypothetical protein n=1 Tax=Aequorivita capsosiphonis TaxID=487317 RepID=UPI00040BC6F2|nr:hypothetical protein [Aequorivita capsosiphonis]
MKNSLILLVILNLFCNYVFGQNKKELRSTVLRLQADSTSLTNKYKENTATISSLTVEVSEGKDLNTQLKTQLADLTLDYDATKTKLTDSIVALTDSNNILRMKLDSLSRFARINHFVKTFYTSLELSDEENLRQYEEGYFKFDLENFNSLVSNNARYSKERVKNLSSDKSHNKYFIMLESIEEIKFSLNKILVKTRVMYSGDDMGLFYNEEQLTLRENKGLLKLTDWVDLDLYKMMPTIETSVENVTREDFYKWIDNVGK